MNKVAIAQWVAVIVIGAAIGAAIGAVILTVAG